MAGGPLTTKIPIGSDRVKNRAVKPMPGCWDRGEIMNDLPTVDYSVLDKPEVLERLFHPRREFEFDRRHRSIQDISIPVRSDIAVGACWHAAGSPAPALLFFHGNGEIAADYDDLGPMFVQKGMSLLVVDYRGYGRSGGTPSVSTMMADCHVILDFAMNFLAQKGHSGPLVVMGRSLGSASALELASTRLQDVHGLIVESGFALAAPLLRLLGIDSTALGFKETQGFRNVDKIRSFDKPTLIIHAEHDHIIPFSDGQMLFENSGAAQKRLLMIAGANHNDIFLRGFDEYLSAVVHLVSQL